MLISEQVKQKTKLFFAILIAMLSCANFVNSQSLSIDDNGVIIGQPIFKSDLFTYYTCTDVVKDQKFINSTFKFLSKMSETYGVAPPQNQDCVVSQSFILGNVISMQYFIDPENAQCFYKSFCNDTRSATFMSGVGGFDMNFMLINAETKTTAYWCYSASRGFLTHSCKE